MCRIGTEDPRAIHRANFPSKAGDYRWNGNSWVLSLTTGDREWHKHAIISYVPPDATYATGTPYNWIPPKYKPTHTDYSSLWNNTSLLEQEVEANYNERIDEYVPWYH